MAANMQDANPDSPVFADHVSLGHYRRRRITGLLGWTVCGACFVLLAFAMLDILFKVLKGGFSAMNLKVLTETTQGVSGGLLQAIEGTMVLTIGSVLIATPLSIGVGVYLSEHRNRFFSKVVRFMSDVLVGVPSIVLGLFGYVALVAGLGWHFSVLAGCITLAVMIIPYISRSVELALLAVPQSLRESAYALGASDASVVTRVLLPRCASRIITGVLLGMALSMGETAPVIYTVGWSDYLWNGQVTHQSMGYLTYVIWSFIDQPYQSAHKLAFAAALLITVMVLLITISTRFSTRYLSVQ